MDVIFWQGPNGELVEMRPAPYDTESVLQTLLAEHPHLIVAGRTDVRLLLVAREQGVPDYVGAADRWSLDHLFVDSEAVPTLVEVKRASDTRIRREVVGQMLDYAANGVKHWPPGSLRVRYEETAGSVSHAEEVFDQFLPGHSPEYFWEEVENNLRAGRLRLVFVADRIPHTLRRIIEFLNEQMDRTEVIGVEVQQYVGDGQTTFVPRVLGQTTAAERVKPRSSSYDEDIASGDEVLRVAAARLDAWALEEDMQTRTTRRAKQFLERDGSYLFQFYPVFGRVEIPVQRLIEAGRPDLHHDVHAAFQALTTARLSQKNLQLPAADIVEHWEAFTERAVPTLRAAIREVQTDQPSIDNGLE